MGAEFNDMLRLVLRLLVDLRDGAVEDLFEECRSGIITTGMAPLFKTSLLDLPLDEVELVVLDVLLDAMLRCRRSGICVVW